MKFGDVVTCNFGVDKPIGVFEARNNDHYYTVSSNGVLDLWLADECEKVPTLHLPISEPWFSRILSGEKTEEYREIKEYYWSRLCQAHEKRRYNTLYFDRIFGDYKPLKVLHLANGYGHHRPQLWAHIKEITIGRGNPEWGAPTDRDVFIIKLGEVFHTKNLKVVN